MKEKLLPFIQKYKFLAIPFIPLLFFLGLLVYIALPQPKNGTADNMSTEVIQVTRAPDRNQPVQETNNTSAISTPANTQESLLPEYEEETIPDPITDPRGLLQTEKLSNGTSKYTYDSGIPRRPDIIIAGPRTDTLLFQRSVIPANTITLESYISAYGQSERIIQGSLFYGPQAQTYIFASRGIAFIADPITGYVLELHTFNAITLSEYIQLYGEDIPANQR